MTLEPVPRVCHQVLGHRTSGSRGRRGGPLLAMHCIHACTHAHWHLHLHRRPANIMIAMCMDERATDLAPSVTQSAAEHVAVATHADTNCCSRARMQGWDCRVRARLLLLQSWRSCTGRCRAASQSILAPLCMHHCAPLIATLTRPAACALSAPCTMRHLPRTLAHPRQTFHLCVQRPVHASVRRHEQRARSQGRMAGTQRVENGHIHRVLAPQESSLQRPPRPPPS
mmetsp:Transcript_19234/g.61201  ORF Transcript_19234/g.61201 Transcript_19234/m.61201 type:complete len:227 (-) Transcript_19234:4-684(-)